MRSHTLQEVRLWRHSVQEISGGRLLQNAKVLAVSFAWLCDTVCNSLLDMQAIVRSIHQHLPMELLYESLQLTLQEAVLS